MLIKDFIPEGWAFYTSDFSIQALHGCGEGRVTLVRDMAEKAKWHEKYNGLEGDNFPPLYINGKGNDFMDSLRDACRKCIDAPAI